MERNSVKKLQLFLVLTHITPVVKFKVEKAWRRYCFYILVFSVTKVVLISGFLFHTQKRRSRGTPRPTFQCRKYR